MFRIERQQAILSYINQHKTVRTQELAEAFHTSRVTVRNDINDLAGRGLVIKTHGGAVCQQQASNTEIPSVIRLQQNKESKQAIGALAAGMIHDGDVVILDAGSTTLEIAKRIKAHNATVITNDLKIAITLADRGGVNLIVTGGTLLSSVYTLVGAEPIDFLSGIKVHKLFLGCDAIDFQWGITNRTFEESHIKCAMIDAAQEVIAVADCSKFHRQVFSRVCDLRELDVLVTDHITPEERELLKNAEVQVRVAPSSRKAKESKDEAQGGEP